MEKDLPKRHLTIPTKQSHEVATHSISPKDQPATLPLACTHSAWRDYA